MKTKQTKNSFKLINGVNKTKQYRQTKKAYFFANFESKIHKKTNNKNLNLKSLYLS
jgi:hypothetical protein